MSLPLLQSRIIDVIPLNRGGSKEILSYFTSQKPPLGSLISIPVRKKTIDGIVVAVREASESKEDLRSSSFTLKRAGNVRTNHFLRPEFIRAAKKAADYYVSSTGTLLFSLIPKAILDGSVPATKKEFQPGEYSILALQASTDSRFSHYKSLIREEFAKKRSLIFIFPTIKEATEAKEVLGRGISDYLYEIHSSLKKDILIKNWKNALKETHPIVIFGTSQCISLPREDLGTIIIEKENNSKHFSQRTSVDIRVFAELYAKEANLRLVVGDTILRTETVVRIKRDEILELTPHSFRLEASVPAELINMKKTTTDEQQQFAIFSNNLLRDIKKALDEEKHVFLFGARRGLASTTVCSDCGTLVECLECEAPVTLHHFKEENFFLCHKCGTARSAAERCRNCQGWKLTALGIGIERIENELRNLFPDTELFRIESGNVKNKKEGEKIARQFYKTPSSILVGTEMALQFLNEQVTLGAVVTMDALLSVPEFRIEEKIFRLIFDIRKLAKEKFVLQTRNPERDIFNFALSNNLKALYQKEVTERKRWKYPPFTTLIKIIRYGKREKVEQEVLHLEKLLKEYNPISFPSLSIRIKGQYVMATLLKVPKEDWPEEKLLSLLRSLPPYWRIKVDPENIL